MADPREDYVPSRKASVSDNLYFRASSSSMSPRAGRGAARGFSSGRGRGTGIRSSTATRDDDDDDDDGGGSNGDGADAGEGDEPSYDAYSEFNPPSLPGSEQPPFCGLII